MKISKKDREKLEAKISDRFREKDEIVVIGNIGLSGTKIITEQKKEELKQRFSNSFLNNVFLLDAAAQEEYTKALQFLKTENYSLLHPMGEGGFLTALWETAEVSEVGLSVDYRRIPIKQETIEICDYFDLNPYQIFSEKCLIVGTPAGASLAMRLNRAGITAALIGNVEKSAQRLLYNENHISYLRKPEEDMMRKVLALC